MAIQGLPVGPTVTAYADDDRERVVAIPNPEPPPLIGIPAQFGWEVAAFKTALGQLVIVGGAPRDFVGGVDAGAVHLIDGTTGALIRTIPNPAPASGDDFGFSVAVDRHGNIIVGAEQDADPDGSGPIPPVAEAGAAFVFDGTTGELLHTLSAPGRSLVELFGASVAVDRRNKIIVGAPGKSVDGVVGGRSFSSMRGPARSSVPSRIRSRMLATSSGSQSPLTVGSTLSAPPGTPTRTGPARSRRSLAPGLPSSSTSGRVRCSAPSRTRPRRPAICSGPRSRRPVPMTRAGSSSSEVPWTTTPTAPAPSLRRGTPGRSSSFERARNDD